VEGAHERVKRIAVAAGLPVEEFAGHSLRADFATSAAAVCVEEYAIMGDHLKPGAELVASHHPLRAARTGRALLALMCSACTDLHRFASICTTRLGELRGSLGAGATGATQR